MKRSSSSLSSFCIFATISLLPILVPESTAVHWIQPEDQPYRFIQEPPNRVDFLNELGVIIPCQPPRLLDGGPSRIQWFGADNKLLQNVTNFRLVLPNGSLYLMPFKPESYRQDLHTTTYKCVAFNNFGSLRSRDVHVRAVVAQQWTARVRSDPSEINLSKVRKKDVAAVEKSVLFKCDIDLIGGGREFIEVLGWKWGQHHFAVKPHSVAGERGGRFHVVPNGDLIVDKLQSDDAQAKIVCFTRHRFTRQEMQSPPYQVKLTESTVVGATANPSPIERYPETVVVEEGRPLVLHCAGAYGASSVRWERLTSGLWIELLSFATDKSTQRIGTSLVILKSKQIHTGQYRCTYFFKSAIAIGSGIPVGEEGLHVEYQVKVAGDEFLVKATINQDKTPLGGSAELVCTSNSNDGPVSVSWFKDNSLITPGGRFRLLGNNVLQISQIQREDQGFYQCFGRRERESAQSAVRLQLAYSAPRLVLGFLDQTLGGPGPDISLRCVFHSGHPLPIITWTVDGYPPPLDPSRIIIGDHMTSHGDVIAYYNITGSRTEDGGLYSCNAVNKVASVRHSARLNIYGNPWIRSVPPVVAISGEFLELQCPVSGYPIAGIGWEKGGLKISSSTNGSGGKALVGPNGTLTISAVERGADSGSYTCSAWDSSGHTARRDIQVNVVAPLRIAPFPEKSSVVEEERVTLVCALSSGSGTLKWEKVPVLADPGHAKVGPGSRGAASLGTFDNDAQEDKEGAPFNVVETDGFTSLLSIPAVKASHAGSYVCTAFDSISTVSRSHLLTVLVAPKWTQIPPRNRNATRGDEVLLNCAGHGTPTPTVTWLRATGDSRSGDPKWRPVDLLWPSGTVQILRNGSLVFLEAEQVHDGEYSCKLENSVGIAESKPVRLTVNVPPYFARPLERLSVSQGKSHEVTCEVHGDAPMDVVWMKADGGVIGNNPNNRIYTTAHHTEGKKTSKTLHLNNLEPVNDGGIYQCIANNSLGRIAQTFHLAVEEKPTAPQELKVTEIHARQLTLEWRPPTSAPSDGGDEDDSMEGKPRILLYVLEYSLEGESNNEFAVNKLEVPGDVTRVQVDNLVPASTYVLKVAAVNSAGNGPQARVTVKTKAAPPAGAVMNVRALPLASNKIMLSWSPVSKELSFGRILAYKITFTSHTSGPETQEIFIPATATALPQKSDNFTSPSKTPPCCQYAINGLAPFTQYEILIAAVNCAGIGASSGIVHVRTLEDVPESSIRYVNCIQLSSTSLQLSWQISTVANNGLVNSYKIQYYAIYEKPGQPQTVQTAGTTAVLSGLEPSTNYSVHVKGANRIGEGFESVTVFCQTLEDVPSAPINLQAFAGSDTLVYLNWLPPNRLNGALTHYTVYFKNTHPGPPTETKRKIAPVSSIHIEANLDLKRYTYTFWLTASTSKGESVASNEVTVGGATTGTAGKPWLIGQSRTVLVREGQPLNLQCGLISGTGSDSGVKWISGDGKPVTSAGTSGTIRVKPEYSELMFSSVRRSNRGNYTCELSGGGKKLNNKQDSVKFQLRVLSKPAPPVLEYRLEGRNILVWWTPASATAGVDGGDDSAPSGFILFYKTLRSSLDWKRVHLLPSQRNYTIRSENCGYIINIYMVAFNGVGTSADSGALNVHLNHHISKLPTRDELLIVNSTSLRLNLYSLNINKTFCPATAFSVALRESSRSSASSDQEWLPGKEEKIPYKSNHVIYGLKESTSYELSLTAFGGVSGSRSESYSFVTLNDYGEPPAIDVTLKNMVRDYSPFYSNLTLILPVVVAVIAVAIAAVTVLAYWRTKRRAPNVAHLVSRPSLPPVLHPTLSRKGAPPPTYFEQYSTLRHQRPPSPPHFGNPPPIPILPAGLTQHFAGHHHQNSAYPSMIVEDMVSPYATFQLSDSRDPANHFRDDVGVFSQDIVVPPKFYDVMQEGPYRSSTESYYRAAETAILASEPSESRLAAAAASNSTSTYDDRWSAKKKESRKSLKQRDHHRDQFMEHHHHNNQDPGAEPEEDEYQEMGDFPMEEQEDPIALGQYYTSSTTSAAAAHLLNTSDAIKAELFAKHYNLTHQHQLPPYKLESLPDIDMYSGVLYGVPVGATKLHGMSSIGGSSSGSSSANRYSTNERRRGDKGSAGGGGVTSMGQHRSRAQHSSGTATCSSGGSSSESTTGSHRQQQQQQLQNKYYMGTSSETHNLRGTSSSTADKR